MTQITPTLGIFSADRHAGQDGIVDTTSEVSSRDRGWQQL
jgi:hypothetical protein